MILSRSTRRSMVEGFLREKNVDVDLQSDFRGTGESFRSANSSRVELDRRKWDAVPGSRTTRWRRRARRRDGVISRVFVFSLSKRNTRVVISVELAITEERPLARGMLMVAIWREALYRPGGRGRGGGLAASPCVGNSRNDQLTFPEWNKLLAALASDFVHRRTVASLS